MRKNKEEKKEVSFLPGSVMLQYVNDSVCFVGMVARDRMADRLDARDLRTYNAQKDREDACAIYLILGWFAEDQESRWSIFSGSKKITFPSYTVGEKRAATPINFTEELSLFRLHTNEPVSRGLNFGKLRKRIFGFSEKQKETLRMVALVGHFIAGGGVENIPKWLEFYGDMRSILNEFHLAVA